jgi:hypothetical protein
MLGQIPIIVGWQHFVATFPAVLQTLALDCIYQFFFRPVECGLRTGDDIIPQEKVCCLRRIEPLTKIGNANRFALTILLDSPSWISFLLPGALKKCSNLFSEDWTGRCSRNMDVNRIGV